jgi:predicted 2-oxoglutarate/Fe(II)-dependent dioxygenase YbiX
MCEISDHAFDLTERINDEIFKASVEYCKKNGITTINMDKGDCNFNRYTEGDFIKIHKDVYDHDIASLKSHRHVTCLLILSIGEGGNLHFPEYELNIAPEPNTLYIFPSTALHEVEPTKSGNRMSYSIWIHN